MTQTRILGLFLFGCVAAITTGCNGKPSGAESSSNPGSSSSKKIKVQGSGASFPAPLYTQWFQAYTKKTPGITVDYQAKGSGAGIKDLVNETVDFASSDAAMTTEEMEQVKKGVVLLPMTAGKVVLTYNLPGGPSELKLTREAYVKILKGEITRWNDPVLVACNGGFAMPATNITVVVRSDSSGTTYVLSKHLSEIDANWKEAFGVNKSIKWPNSDRFVKGPKNDGVMALVKQTPGAIGYVEYGFAKQIGQTIASLENQAGEFVKPTLESGLAALSSSSEVPDDLILWVPDPAGKESYPIVTYTWMICYKKYDDAAKAEAIRNLISYCLTEGQKESDALGYLPLPASVVEKVQAAANQIQ